MMIRRKANPQKNTLLKTAASQPCKPKFLREYFFLQPREEFYFFSPTLRCFNFFATAQPTTDKQSESLLQTKSRQCNLTRTTEARTANKGLPKAGVTSFYDNFVLNLTFVFQMNGSAEMPRLRQAPNRYPQPLTAPIEQ